MSGIIKHYYKAVKNPEKKQRYEIVAGTFDYQLFERALKNLRNPNKGGLSFNFGQIPNRFNSKARSNGDYCLSRGGSISTIYMPNKSLPYGWGDVQNPNSKIRVNDALLLVLSHDLEIIEVFIAPGHRNVALQLYQSLCDGFFKEQLDYMRSLSEGWSNVA